MPPIVDPSPGCGYIELRHAAVLVDTVSRFLPQLIRYGRIEQPGIARATLVSEASTRSNGIETVAIDQVEAGSPSDEAPGVGASVRLSVMDGRTDRQREVRVKLYDLR